jgi:hypothetical protein
MWRRLRRKTFAPTRPILFPEQYGLALLSGVVIVAGLVIVAYVLWG